jgi:hypothetical protein
MKLTRPRFTVRRLMLLVALLAMNLATLLLAVLPRYRVVLGPIVPGPPSHHTTRLQRPDGSLWAFSRNALTGELVSSDMIEPPTPRGLIRVWWPLAASIAVSLVALPIARRSLVAALTVRRVAAVVALVGVVLGLGEVRERRERFSALEMMHVKRANVVQLRCDGCSDPIRLAAYHWLMAEKYARAARTPWLPVAPDPPEPR